MRRWFIHLFLRFFTIFGIGWSVTYFFKRAFEEVSALEKAPPSLPKLLFLNPTRYRGDIESIAATGKFRVFTMAQSWMGRTFGNFYPRSKDGPLDFLLATPSPEVLKARRDHRALLRSFWPSLLRREGIKLVIGAGYHYAQDRDYGFVTVEAGIPFVVIHRETFKASPAHREDVLSRAAKLESFAGSKIFFHNRLLGELLLQSGFIQAKHVVTAGSIRADALAAKIGKEPRVRDRSTQVTLFSFFHRAGLNQSDPDFTNQFSGMWSKNGISGFVKLFDEVHAAFAELAFSSPDVKFVIKTKWGGRWHEKIVSAIEKAGVKVSDVPNLVITDEGDAADLIISSSTVVSFQSTTLAEALLSGCRVVYPYFAEAQLPEYEDWLLLYEDRDLFDVATSKSELKAMVSLAVAHPEIDQNTVLRRRAVFERFVSPTDGKVLDTYVRKFRHLIDSKC